ncbi:MAG: putative tail fiber protein [Prokaryotic dsDNA virus sp.]|jgi:hypothetical protein|nr:hypothetical protein [Flavobacteriaceae bacterium]QDP68315.1 MAG: putative tail fiber protein [Prokaryotic dsDNA virus sp.]|tara:strand:- start:8737 stop:11616 length:2880 start_codon:yes stop_codon:yes gene_type:complete
MAAIEVNTGANTIVAYLVDLPFNTSDSFTFSFPYLDQTDFKLEVDKTTVLDAADYTFTSDYLIQLTQVGVDKLNAIYPIAGETQVPLTINRSTQLDTRLVDFQDGANLTEEELDLNANQTFYLLQEAYDNFLNGSLQYDPVTNTVDANTAEIVNVGDPTNEDSATNLGTVLELLGIRTYTQGEIYKVGALIEHSNILYKVTTELNPAPVFDVGNMQRIVSYVELDTITVNQSDILALQNAMTLLTNRVSQNESDISALQNTTSVNTTALSDTESILGVTLSDQDLGTFSGSTITDDNNVKGALQELETAVESAGTIGGDLATHEADTSTHGVTEIVGTTEIQTLTNKTLQGASITDTEKLVPRKDTLTNLTSYASSSGTEGEKVYATDLKKSYTITDGALVESGGSGGSGSATSWGLVSADTVLLENWTTTGTGAVSLQGGTTYVGGLDGSQSFSIDLPAANDSAEIEVEIPYRAVDAQSNQTTLSYMNYDGNPVTFEVYDFDGNLVRSVDLKQTGSGLPFISEARFKTINIDWMLPWRHGSLDRKCTFKFVSELGTAANLFYVDFIQSDSNPRSIGQWVEVNSVVARNADDEAITADTENIPYQASGKGWDTINFQYTVQSSSSIIDLSFGARFTSSGDRRMDVYVNGSFYATGGVKTTASSVAAGECSGISDLVAGDIISIRMDTGGTINDSEGFNYLNITEAVNRRSIMSEVDFGEVQEYTIPSNITGTATVTTFNVAPNTKHLVDLSSMMTRASGSGSLTIDITDGTSTLKSLRLDTDHDAHIQPFGASLIVESPTGVIEIDASASSNDFIYGDNNLTGINSFIQVSPVFDKQAISIPVDEIIADGNEYAVFGKRIKVNDVWYQVFRRGVDGTSGTKLTGLPNTLKPVGAIWHKLTSIDAYQNIIGTNTNYVDITYYYDGANEGDLTITYGGAYTSDADIVYPFDYYDTARPLYS